MISKAADYLVLTLAAAPFIYYLLVLYSSRLFFRQAKNGSSTNLDFAPPVSNLKPVRGLDPEAYENFASYCRQDYPDYELIFCVGDENDASVPVLQKLMRDFLERQIRILYGSGRNAINDKVAKLVRMVHEARFTIRVVEDNPEHDRRILYAQEGAPSGIHIFSGKVVSAVKATRLVCERIARHG